MNDIRELNDAELEAVSGGMDCKTALIVSDIYATTALALRALGNDMMGNFFAGKAAGVAEGGCL